MNEDLEAALALLSSFSGDQFADWIHRFLNDLAVEPSVSRGLDSPHLVLNAIYDQLPASAQVEFAAGLSRLFPLIRPDSSEAGVRQSFSLLKVTDHVSPWQVRPAMFSRLTSGCMRGVTYGGWDLHTLLLVACCHSCVVDQQLEDYIFRSVPSSDDFQYQLVAFRQLLRLGGLRPFLLLEQLAPALRTPGHSERLAEVVVEALEDRSGGWPLLVWLQDVAPRLRSKGVEGLDELEQVLREALPWRPESSRNDPGFLLASAWIHAPFRYFRASDLIYLSYTLLPLELQEPFQNVREDRLEMLNRVLRRILQHGEPWVCIDGHDRESPWNRIRIGDVFRIITYSRDGTPDEADEPREGFLREFRLLSAIVAEVGTSAAIGASTHKRHSAASASALAARSI